MTIWPVAPLHTATAISKRAGVILVLSSAVIAGASRSSAQGTVTDMAYVEAVRGRVIVFVKGSPTLLEELDIVDENARLDLETNSELHLCHYRTRKIVTLRGPLRATVAASGVSAENGKPVEVSKEDCATPVLSTVQGGFITRNVVPATVEVPPRPSIKVVNRGKSAIRKAALWDSNQQTLLVTFERNLARPALDPGRSYLLVVEQADGAESKILLHANTGAQAGPLIVTVR